MRVCNGYSLLAMLLVVVSVYPMPLDTPDEDPDVINLMPTAPDSPTTLTPLSGSDATLVSETQAPVNGRSQSAEATTTLPEAVTSVAEDVGAVDKRVNVSEDAVDKQLAREESTGAPLDADDVTNLVVDTVPSTAATEATPPVAQTISVLTEVLDESAVTMESVTDLAKLAAVRLPDRGRAFSEVLVPAGAAGSDTPPENQATPGGEHHKSNATQAPPANLILSSSSPQAPTASEAPTPSPTQARPATETFTSSPTQAPSASEAVTSSPTQAPSASEVHTSSPTQEPPGSEVHTFSPTQAPPASEVHTSSPTQAPPASETPTSSPTQELLASEVHTSSPTQAPPASEAPTSSPTQELLASEVHTSSPTQAPPASEVHTSNPTQAPPASEGPTSSPTQAPPASEAPTSSPTQEASASEVPTSSPSQASPASDVLTSSPTQAPPASEVPTSSPTQAPPASEVHPSSATKAPATSEVPTSSHVPDAREGSTASQTFPPTEKLPTGDVLSLTQAPVENENESHGSGMNKESPISEFKSHSRSDANEVPATEEPDTDKSHTLASLESPVSRVPESEVSVSEVPSNRVPVSGVTESEVIESGVKDIPASEVSVKGIKVSELPATDGSESGVTVSDILASKEPAREVPASEVPVTVVPANTNSDLKVQPFEEAPSTNTEAKEGADKFSNVTAERPVVAGAAEAENPSRSETTPSATVRDGSTPSRGVTVGGAARAINEPALSSPAPEQRVDKPSCADCSVEARAVVSANDAASSGRSNSHPDCPRDVMEADVRFIVILVLLSALSILGVSVIVLVMKFRIKPAARRSITMSMCWRSRARRATITPPFPHHHANEVDRGKGQEDYNLASDDDCRAEEAQAQARAEARGVRGAGVAGGAETRAQDMPTWTFRETNGAAEETRPEEEVLCSKM